MGSNTDYNAFAGPLRAAAKGGHTDLVEVLLKKYRTAPQDKFLNASDPDGCTALYHAAANGHSEVVGLLLNQAGIEPAQLNVKKWTALRAALVGESEESAELLLEHDKVKGTRAANDNWNALAHASSLGYVNVVRLLLSSPEVANEVNELDAEECTPLYLAANGGHIRVVKQLLKKGANINLTSRGRVTPLYGASSSNHPQVVDFLIREGANPNLSNKDGEEPLMAALNGGYATVVDLLIEAKASWTGVEKPVGKAPSALTGKDR